MDSYLRKSNLVPSSLPFPCAQIQEQRKWNKIGKEIKSSTHPPPLSLPSYFKSEEVEAKAVRGLVWGYPVCEQHILGLGTESWCKGPGGTFVVLLIFGYGLRWGHEWGQWLVTPGLLSAVAFKVRALHHPFPPPVPTGKIWCIESWGRLWQRSSSSEHHRDKTKSCDVGSPLMETHTCLWCSIPANGRKHSIFSIQSYIILFW